jgi:hypothetical protein
MRTPSKSGVRVVKRSAISATSSSIAVLLCALSLVSTAKATTVTDQFSFYDGSAVIASGSFSYDPSKYSGLLTFNELTAFTISGQSQTYGLSDVQGLLNSYNYFGFDTNLQTFVPAIVSGYGAPADGILAAVNSDGSSGFFFDPLPGQSDPLLNGGNDGFYSFSQNCNYCVTGPYPSYTAFTISAVSGVPEASTWVMMLLGFVGVGFSAHRRRLGLMFKFR